MTEILDAAWRHADGLSAQLEKPNWRPSRAHIEQARNTIRKVVNEARKRPLSCSAETELRNAIEDEVEKWSGDMRASYPATEVAESFIRIMSASRDQSEKK